MKTPPPPAAEPRRPLWILALVFVACAGGAHLLHRQLPQIQDSLEGPAILPDVRALRVLSLGHHTSVADLYWLKWVQYVGTPSEAERGWPLLEALSEQVVGLDHLYGYAYQSAGVVLATANRFESSNAILERGMEQIADRWQLPFLAGYNYWNGLRDMKRGGELLLKASKLPGSPFYLAELSTRLFSSSGSIEDGLALIEASLAMSDDPLIHKELERRHNQLLAERALQTLERAIADHRASTNQFPPSLDALDQPEVRAILAEKFGETVEYDSNTGTVRSLLLPKRLVVYNPPKVPEALAAP